MNSIHSVGSQKWHLPISAATHCNLSSPFSILQLRSIFITLSIFQKPCNPFVHCDTFSTLITLNGCIANYLASIAFNNISASNAGENSSQFWQYSSTCSSIIRHLVLHHGFSSIISPSNHQSALITIFSPLQMALATIFATASEL